MATGLGCVQRDMEDQDCVCKALRVGHNKLTQPYACDPDLGTPPHTSVRPRAPSHMPFNAMNLFSCPTLGGGLTPQSSCPVS